jgi:sarcosine oxidase/L-pipecolate oxidase
MPHEVLSGSEANQRYPRQLKLPPTHKCVYEDMGGIIYAQRALLAFQREFQRLGGRLLEGHRVREIVPGDVVTLVTDRGSFKTRNVVIAAGPWAPALCSSIGLHLPFKTKRIEVLYWKVENPAAYSSEVFPTTSGSLNGDAFYSSPIEEYPDMIKVCLHRGEWTDPDERDKLTGPVAIPTVAEYIRSTFRGVATQPSIVEYCLYTISPDYNPVIDRHPKHKNIIIAAGFTGHGFKLSPVIGKLVAQLVRRETPSHSLHPFRVSRFLTPQSHL